jgi:hypothetical protein
VGQTLCYTSFGKPAVRKTVKAYQIIKNPFRSRDNHFGALQAGVLNFKNSSQAPQTA